MQMYTLFSLKMMIIIYCFYNPSVLFYYICSKTHMMTFTKALKHKKLILKNSSAFTKTLYDYLIIPAIAEESKKFLDDFRKSPSSFTDESCKHYSSNSRFKIFLYCKSRT